MGKDLFCELRDALKAEHPTLSISVRRCRVSSSVCGYCKRMPDQFLIRISSSLTEQEQLDTLIHEIAHAASWIEWENTQQHGPLWGLEYSKAYRVYEKIVSAE
jgi:hypothetical protein